MKNDHSDSDDTRTHPILAKDTMVSHYRIVEKIGAGGMGEVYLAQDTQLDRPVALKFLPGNLAADEKLKSRFVREAKAAAKLNHPHIVTIYEVGEYASRPFFAMEYVRGRSLHHFAHQEQLPISQIIEYAIQLCQGLGEAHRAGIVHRDIKTANISVDAGGRIRILDFGLASIQGADQLTKTGSTLGTVSYMSPEQVSGRAVDLRSDLFSLGIVLYELIAGRTPFKRDNEGATLKAIMEDTPEPLSRFKADVPDPLQRIVDKLLEKDVELRYQSAEGVIADLKKLIYDSQQSVLENESSRTKRKPRLAILLAAVIVILAGGLAMIFGGSGTTDTKAVPVLAIMPFENLGSPEDEYFAVGITDEISSRLATVSGMRVISRSSASKYKNTEKSVGEIGNELGADYILEGTIRWDKSGDVERIRITPRLTQTSNDYQLWAQNYERKLTQIFEVQAEIADQIADQLDLTLVEADEFERMSSPTSNMAAYDYYLRGMEFVNEGIYMANLQAAIKMYDSAVTLDPNFALAWAQKSVAHTNYEFGYTLEDNGVNSEAAKDAAERALELDPNLPAAHVAMGTYYNLIERDYDKALREFSRAESEMSSNADLFEAIGIVKMRQDKWVEAIYNFEKAAQVDPLNVRRYYWLATCNSMIRDFKTANQYISRALALSPTNVDAVYLKALMGVLEYGDINVGGKSFESMASEAGLAKVATYEMGVTSVIGLWRFLDDLSPGELIPQIYDLGEERSRHVVYLNVAQLYDLSGNRELAHIYYDSSRMVLEKMTDSERNVDYDIYASLGLTYAFLGKAEEAIKAGNKAKELMSIDDCHW